MLLDRKKPFFLYLSQHGTREKIFVKENYTLSQIARFLLQSNEAGSKQCAARRPEAQNKFYDETLCELDLDTPV